MARGLRVISKDLGLPSSTCPLVNRMWHICCYGLYCNKQDYGDPNKQPVWASLMINWTYRFDRQAGDQIASHRTGRSCE